MKIPKRLSHLVHPLLVAVMQFVKKEMALPLVLVYLSILEILTAVVDPNVLQVQTVLRTKLVSIINVETLVLVLVELMLTAP